MLTGRRRRRNEKEEEGAVESRRKMGTMKKIRRWKMIIRSMRKMRKRRMTMRRSGGS